jgi:hypothetical protein
MQIYDILILQITNTIDNNLLAKVGLIQSAHKTWPNSLMTNAVLMIKFATN